MEPNESTVVIADAGGTVLFGYSDGRWLTHSQAAAYCGGYMKFYSISLNGKKASVTSKTAELEEESEPVPALITIKCLLKIAATTLP